MSVSDPDLASTPVSIAVVGAGIIGLACARELARRGAHVTLFGRGAIERSASWAAAGMLAPSYEAALADSQVHPRLLELCNRGAHVWPDFARRLEGESGGPLGYVAGPSLAVSCTPEGLSRLDALHMALVQRCGSGRVVSGDEARRIEPALGSACLGALVLDGDGQIDNRAVLRALSVQADTCAQITRVDDQPDARALSRFDTVLITAGWRASEAGRFSEAGEVDGALRSIMPVSGQMLSVEPVAGGPAMTIREADLYIVPKGDRIVIGATVEPGLVRERPDPAVIEALRARAATLCPALARARVIESWTGTRPGTPDHAPLIGQTAVPGVFVAAGHYRNGILLAPITAQLMADRLLEGRADPLLAAFAPDRFRCAGV